MRTQPGTDTISFDPLVFDGEPQDVIRLTLGEILINGSLIIDGGAGVTISGDANGDDVTDASGITDVSGCLGRICSMTTAGSSMRSAATWN